MDNITLINRLPRIFFFGILLLSSIYFFFIGTEKYNTIKISEINIEEIHKISILKIGIKTLIKYMIFPN